MADVRIKGTRKGVTVIIEQGDPQGIVEELRTRLTSVGFFLQGSRVTLEVRTDDLGIDGLKAICGLIRDSGMVPIRLVSESRSVRRAAQALGLAAERPSSEKPEYALVKYGPIRSGQKISYEGSVLVIGDVNPGAELIAGGDIVVWGQLKGRAFAGAPDNPSRRIYALRLEPSLLGIGGYIARPPEGETRLDRGPEVALVQGNRIVVEPWEPKTRRGED